MKNPPPPEPHSCKLPQTRLYLPATTEPQDVAYVGDIWLCDECGNLYEAVEGNYEGQIYWHQIFGKRAKKKIIEKYKN